MATRTASAKWQGKLQDGSGSMTAPGLGQNFPFSADSRFGDGKATNPEELIGAAHAGCFSMALSHGLEEAGFTPETIETKASVKIEQVDDGFKITSIHLETSAKVSGIDESKFKDIVEATKTGCPVSKALAGTEITVEYKLST